MRPRGTNRSVVHMQFQAEPSRRASVLVLAIGLAVASAALQSDFASLTSASAWADDVPLPVKKPKDAKGQVIVGTPDRDHSHAPSLHGNPRPASNLTPKSWPKTIADAEAEAAAKAQPETVPTTWSAAEIAEAKARCKVILDQIDAVTLPEEPFRHGDCGTPAPVRLIAIGRSPEIAISPPAVLTCGMVGALHTWATKDLQPLAQKHLGGAIIKIESMSDYSCRNAYGRTKTKLSEHGRANALDIRGFVTESGKLAFVLEGWGETQRDIAARLAAAKAAQQKQEAKEPAPAGAIVTGAITPAPVERTPSSPAGSVVPRATLTDGIPRPTPASGVEPATSLTPAHLGGPKPKVISASPAVSAFLKAAHRSACQIFGTTLGPEANNAHRNHFHLDMAPRARSNFCE